MVDNQIILAYLEVAVTMLVFGVGLPFLIFERPIWLRRIREKHSRWSRKSRIGIPIAIAVSTALLIGYVLDISPLLECKVNTSMLDEPLCTSRTYLREYSNPISSGLIVVAIFLMMTLWYRLRLYSFSYVLNQLQRQTLDCFEKNLQLATGKIFDIGNLGLGTELESHRRHTLKTLKRISEKVPIEGADVNSLVNSIVWALLKTIRHAEETDTFAAGIQVLVILSGRLAEEYKGKDLKNQPTAIDTVLINLSRIGALAFKNDSVILLPNFAKCLNYAEPENRSKILFELGVEALTAKNYHAAMYFFNTAESLASQYGAVNESPESYSNDVIIYYVGFASRIHASNSSAELAIRDRLFKTFGNRGTTLSTCIVHCKEVFSSIADFETADAVTSLELSVC